MKSVEKLFKLINEIEKRIPYALQSNTTVSKVGVAWHLDHSVKVIIGISKQLLRSDASTYIANFSFSRSILFTLGFIPRGRGKSPKVVLPPETILIEDITAQVEMAKELVSGLKDLPKNAHFAHPVFGTLNTSKAIRFIELHSRHHLKIIDEILNKKPL